MQVLCFLSLSRGPDEVAWLGWAGLDMGWSLFGVEAGRESREVGDLHQARVRVAFFSLGLEGWRDAMGLDCLGARKRVQAAALAG
jgi:hypothetical protein